MSNDLRPRLFQIVIKGSAISYDASGVDYEIDHQFSTLQIVADEGDLEMSIEIFKEDFHQVEEVSFVEINVGYSPFCHDVFINGYKGISG